MQLNSRISRIDSRSAESDMRYREGHISKLVQMLADEPNKLRQRRLSSLSSDQANVGMLKYVLAYKILECRDVFVKSLHTSIEAFRLRGTQEAFPVMDLVFDPSKPKGDPNRARLTERHSPGTKDYSATNSNKAYWYTCLGVAVGQETSAREIASMIWDPPDADYIGLRSIVCTPNQQALAYALKHYLEGNKNEAIISIVRVRTLPDDYVGIQAQLLRSLIEQSSDAFLRNLEELLDRHEKLSRREKWDKKLYICVPALGISALAIKSGLIDKTKLPDNVYLPLELIGPGIC